MPATPPARTRLSILLGVLALACVAMIFVVAKDQPDTSAGAARSNEDTASPPSLPPDADATASATVLFIGNSFVFVNDLPAMLRGLGASDGIAIRTSSHTPGGARLREQAANDTVRALLTQRWDHVVLQEQSQLPAIDSERRESTAPALLDLVARAKSAGSKPVLFASWGYENGDRANAAAHANDDYAAMQSRLDHGFAELTREADIPLVPVSRAWAEAHRTHPEIALWGADGKHPAPAGTYLAACVFYRALFAKSAVGNRFTAGLPAVHAGVIQEIAQQTPSP